MTACPRCNIPWNRRGTTELQHCASCRLTVYTNPTEIRLEMSEYDEHDRCVKLWWELDRECCFLITKTGGVIWLPLLPYTITQEQLDKYLVLV